MNPEQRSDAQAYEEGNWNLKQSRLDAGARSSKHSKNSPSLPSEAPYVRGLGLINLIVIAAMVYSVYIAHHVFADYITNSTFNAELHRFIKWGVIGLYVVFLVFVLFKYLNWINTCKGQKIAVASLRILSFGLWCYLLISNNFFELGTIWNITASALIALFLALFYMLFVVALFIVAYPFLF
jgi:hypothetical protein